MGVSCRFRSKKPMDCSLERPWWRRSEDSRVPVGPELLGRVLDGFGRPMDDGPRIQTTAAYDLYADAAQSA